MLKHTDAADQSLRHRNTITVTPPPQQTPSSHDSLHGVTCCCLEKLLISHLVCVQ